MFKKLFGFGKKEEEKREEVVVIEDFASDEAIEEENREAIEFYEHADENIEATEAVSTVDAIEPVVEIEKVEVAPVAEVLTSETPQNVEVIEATETFETNEASEETEVAVVEEAKKPSFFERLKSGLSKTSKSITDKIDNLLNNYGAIDDDLFDELEEILITADIGMNTTLEIIEKLKAELRVRKILDASMVKSVMKDVMVTLIREHNTAPLVDKTPAILLVIGVNGAGKTTSIGKIAHRYKMKGKSVLLAAGDTFRAAAIDQLKVWGERAGINVISHQEGSDPAAVIFDAIHAAKARKVDVLICDTAGRLHNKKNLMNELAKVFKVVDREYPEATKEVLLVLDGTTGQNAVQQAKTFSEIAEVTGIVLTKLDGTAKGGVVLSINAELNIPVKLIGVGEGMEDLQDFDPEAFVEAMLNLDK